jgi:hypothetical protein
MSQSREVQARRSLVTWATCGLHRSGDPTGPAPSSPGYLLDQGRYRTIEAADPGVLQFPFDVNNRRRVVGQYVDTGGAVHGFLWERGRFVTIDVPGAPLTTAEGINDHGQVVGYSAADPDLTGARGFLLAKGVKGPFTPVSFPGAPGAWARASTTMVRSSASTRTPRPRRARKPPTHRRWARWPDHQPTTVQEDRVGLGRRRAVPQANWAHGRPTDGVLRAATTHRRRPGPGLLRFVRHQLSPTGQARRHRVGNRSLHVHVPGRVRRRAQRRT